MLLWVLQDVINQQLDARAFRCGCKCLACCDWVAPPAGDGGGAAANATYLCYQATDERPCSPYAKCQARSWGGGRRAPKLWAAATPTRALLPAVTARCPPAVDPRQARTRLPLLPSPVSPPAPHPPSVLQRQRVRVPVQYRGAGGVLPRRGAAAVARPAGGAAGAPSPHPSLGLPAELRLQQPPPPHFQLTNSGGRRWLPAACLPAGDALVRVPCEGGEEALRSSPMPLPSCKV
jgi:hypothetical protein